MIILGTGLHPMSGVNYFSRSATIILPYDDNYELGVMALATYTGADRSRG
jgi:hypothetical protein